MKNISFDNPYWLFLAIPLLVALLIPFFISVSKDNKNKGWIASLVIHIAIAVCLTLSAAGLVHTTVMTRTKVYVVADVSYSANKIWIRSTGISLKSPIRYRRIQSSGSYALATTARSLPPRVRKSKVLKRRTLTIRERISRARWITPPLFSAQTS